MSKKPTLKQFCKMTQEVLNDLHKDLGDCSLCGGICCRDEDLTLTIPDVNKLSRKLGISIKEFKEKYTHRKFPNPYLLMNMPCPFFKDNQCSVYEQRPMICKNYPTLVMNDKQNGCVIIQEIECCPISTHFNELYMDFLEEELPDHYEEFLKSFDKDEKVDLDTFVKNSILGLYNVHLFFRWLGSKDK